MMKAAFPLAVATSMLAGLLAVAGAQDRSADAPGLEKLGETLFFDTDLSRERTQSCATCHDPSTGFADPRGGPVSIGDDGTSLGVRNAPTVSYAAFSPRFGKDGEGNYVGGQFHDGRADTLEDQAGQPLLNPIEMAMPDRASVVARLKEKPAYLEAFRKQFGPDVFDSDQRAFASLTEALAAYERSPAVSPFDSRYDRYLRGEYKMTPQEELGRVLFFSNQFTSCGQCHKLHPSGGRDETFTDYRFHNIGVPRNPELKAPLDHGLLARGDVTDPAHDGQFKVPTLRNVAVTAPYMHNGIFKDLRTVILFYNKYNSSSPKRQIDPETGRGWDPPEVAGTLSMKELETGPALDDRRINALVAFLKTLTDARYEPLLGE
ncbi:methylamine utilization protein MauG [Ancylobacter sp. MQZ15Z-1]|uniref:Methylamine utilization protein MauG n=1 Tax=Ancylobacter mangrovi TaxID=2972472 RepID=A0A9X2PEB3_9HYPH|nr:cytochrome c peroxidase [Ancylobacter mangrovi]MCS0494042.1 methylamine utilization protein MauG [Ancylobacter mangrovi]